MDPYESTELKQHIAKSERQGESSSGDASFTLAKMKSDVPIKKEEIIKRTLESTQRSLKRLTEAEIVGTKTAEKLVRNRDQLTNVSEGLDGMSRDLKNGRRHIESIKSIVSSIKNSLFHRKRDPWKGGKIRERNDDVETHPLDAFVSKRPKDPAPVIPSSEKGSQCNSDSSCTSQKIKELLDSEKASSNFDENPSSSNPFPAAAIDENLNVISTAVQRLKGLATAMGDEIDQHNSILDNINNKSYQVEASMDKQRASIEKLLE